MRVTLTLFALGIGVASAAPSQLLKRATNCGGTTYADEDVFAAIEAACGYVSQDETAGSSSYPHQYRNYEGFEFNSLSGPFYEFPLKRGSAYQGGPSPNPLCCGCMLMTAGSPGADRVVITADCQHAGDITHRGASGNKFVACSGTS